ncbi:MAG: DUF3090 family protein [Thermomicrobiales bacterium]
MLPRDFEQVTRVEAESIGPPGQRRFRLTIENDDECVYLWLEKQHLQALGHAFEQILTHLPGRSGRDTLRSPGREGGRRADELQVGRLQVGYDEERELVVLIVHGIEAGMEDPPDVLARLTSDQVANLSMQIRRVVNMGARQRANGHLRNP